MYSCNLPSTSALDGVGGNATPRTAYPLGKTRYTLCRKLGEPQGRSGRVRKISPPTGIRFPDRPARSESLYRLRYLRPLFKFYVDEEFGSYLITDLTRVGYNIVNE